MSLDAPTEVEARSRKSFSVGSQAESIISVIEAAPQEDFASQVESMARQTELLARQTEQFYGQQKPQMQDEDMEPMPMSARGRPVKRAQAAAAKSQPALTLDIPAQSQPGLTLDIPEQEVDGSGQITPDPFKYRQEPDLSTYKFESSPPVEEQAPPLEELPPKKPQSQSPPKVSPASRSGHPGRRGQPINREPSVGSDRYEDIIVEARKRSLSRPGSRVSSRMGSRTSSQMYINNMSSTGSRTGSQLDFRPGSQLDSRAQIGEYGQSIGKLDLTSLRASLSNKDMASLDLDLRIVDKQPQEINNQFSSDIQEAPAVISNQPPAKQPTVQPSPPAAKKAATTQMMALDANQNSTPASLPTVPLQPVAPGLKQRRRAPAREYKPDPLVELFPKNIPTWVVLTYTYSVVLILILLVANSTPDGKLYIHFTALWSIILYFIIDEDQVKIYKNN